MGYKSWRAYFDSFPWQERSLFVGMILYLVFFGYISYWSGNSEFLLSVLLMFCLFVFLLSYYHRLRMTLVILVGIAIHWFLHFLGGTLHPGGLRLYDAWILPGLFRYDNLVHMFGIFVLTFLAYNLLRPHFTLKDRFSLMTFSLLLVLVVMGIGAFSEIGELFVVLTLDAAESVGDYLNNAFDLLWNFFGALLACFFINRYELLHLTAKITQRKK